MTHPLRALALLLLLCLLGSSAFGQAAPESGKAAPVKADPSPAEDEEEDEDEDDAGEDEEEDEDDAGEDEEEDEELAEELADLRERLKKLELREAKRTRKEASEPPLTKRLPALIDKLKGPVKVTGYVVAGHRYAGREHSSQRPLLRDHSFFAEAALYFKAELPLDFRTTFQVIFNPRPTDEVYPVDEAFEVERAFVQWAPHPAFQLRLGKFVTPVGYWTYLVHDEPLLPTLSTPLMVRRGIFPEEVTGVMVEGELPFKILRPGYAFWLSNGQSLNGGFDDNPSKAVGGRVYLTGEDLGSVGLFKLGVSFFAGKTEQIKDYTVGDPKLRQVAEREHRPQDYFERRFEDRGLAATGLPLEGSRERGLAGDLVLDLWRLRLRIEAAINWISPRATRAGLRPSSFQEWGGYAYLGYSIPLPKLGEGKETTSLGSLEPYVRVGTYDANTDYGHELQSLSLFSTGLLYTLSDNVQVRVEGVRHHYTRVASRSWYGVYSGVVLSY